MAQARRFGPEHSEVRTRFIDAALALLGEAGDHAVTARAIAARAGLKTQLLYYYFRTIDDLLIAVVRRASERRLAGLKRDLASPEPLRAMWRTMTDPANAALAAALTSLASSNPVVREEIVETSRQFRVLQTQAVERLLPQPAPGEPPSSAAGIVLIAAALARFLVNEQTLGLSEGHVEARAIADGMLDRLSP